MKHMKKRRICIAAVLLFSVLLSSCEYAPKSPDTDTGEQTEETTDSFAKQLVGIYKTYSEENGEVIMQIYLIQDQLIAEVEEEYAAYYAMEWMAVDSPKGDNGTASKEFTAYSFSGFSNFGEYWDTVQQITVTLTDAGIEMSAVNGKTTVYTRDEASAPIHVPDKYCELLQDTADASLAGNWIASADDGYTIFLQLDSVGNMIWCCKKDGEPIELYIGGAAVSSEAGTVQTISERVGWAQMPWQYNFEYSFDADGRLILKNTEPDGLLPTECAVGFIKYTDKE